MRNLLPTFRYLCQALAHKRHVLIAGRRTRAPLWRLLIHDWTKFTPAEAPHYGRQFFGSADDPLGFAYAWLHHQNANPHHWEYWVPVSGNRRGGYKDLEPLPMPDWAVREMVADWMAANRTYAGEWPKDMETWKWFRENWPGIKARMHPETVARTEAVLCEIFTAPLPDPVPDPVPGANSGGSTGRPEPPAGPPSQTLSPASLGTKTCSRSTEREAC